MGKKSRFKREEREKFYDRSELDLLKALRHRLRRIRQYLAELDSGGDEQLVADISAQLRALIASTRTNRPLLLDLMDRYSSTTGVRSESPPDIGRVRSLRDYLAEISIKQPLLHSNGHVLLTNHDLVLVCANQLGSHEDPKHDERLAALRAGGVYYGDLPIYVRCLRAVARTIASVGETFIEELERRGIRIPE